MIKALFDICAHCQDIQSTDGGQYSRDGRFYCGGCISMFYAESPRKAITREPDPYSRDYSGVVEFASAPA